MGKSSFQLRSILSLVGFLGASLGSPGLATGLPPSPAAGERIPATDVPTVAVVSHETGAGGSSSGVPGIGADGQPTENWYQFFCGAGWDPAVLIPCGIHGNGAQYHGCANSADSQGARLIVDSGDAGADDVVLYAFGVKPGAMSIFLQGSSKVSSGLPFGDGIRCAAGQVKRLYSRVATGGTVTAPIAGELSIRARSAALGAPIPSPATRYYQVWYRDGLGHCNVSSGLQIDWP